MNLRLKFGLGAGCISTGRLFQTLTLVHEEDFFLFEFCFSNLEYCTEKLPIDDSCVTGVNI